MRAVRPYGCGLFIVDVVLTLLTGGLWLIFVFAREMRYRRRPNVIEIRNFPRRDFL